MPANSKRKSRVARCRPPRDSKSSLGRGMENVKHERRKRATVRERRRMHQLNDAFDRLRSYIPTYPSSEKTSKIQTLKLAIEYIRDLADLLRDTEGRAVYAGEDICLLPRRTPVITSQGILRGNPDSWMDDVATESLQQSQLSDEVVLQLMETIVSSPGSSDQSMFDDFDDSSTCSESPSPL